MSDSKEFSPNSPVITKSSIIQDLRHLGICPGQVIMLHALVKAVG